MSGDYPPTAGEDDYSQFLELMDCYIPYLPSEYQSYDGFPYEPPAHPADTDSEPFTPVSEYQSYGGFPYEPPAHPADTDSEPFTPVSNVRDLGSPPEFRLFVESNPEELPFFLFNTPPADTVSPADLTPTTPRSPGTIADMSTGTPRSPDTIAGLSPSTPRSPSTDGSRASTTPTTPDSPGPENYEPVQMPTGKWRCAFPRCPRDYRRRCDVNKHCKTHTKPFACSSCGQKSSSKRDKERHELSHKLHHPKCPHPLCTSSTSRKDNMRDHIRRKHKDMDPRDPIIDELYSKRPGIQ